MKAIVAEIDKKHMIVITDKGDFIKVKRQMSAGIGDEIELKPQKLYPAYKRLAGLAACFLACIFLSTGVYAYYTPYSYVSVDINPSISLSLNRFEKVIAVSPITEDAVDLIKDTKEIKNQDIDKALTTIIKSASEKGYIDAEEENQVVVVVSAKNQKAEDKLAKEVNKTAAKELAKVNDSSEVMVEKASIKSHKEALANKVSPGKVMLANKLREVEPQLKDEEIKNMSVKEVVKRINEKRKAAATEDKERREDDREAEKHFNSRYKDKDDKNNKASEKRDSKDEKRSKDNDNQKPSAAAGKKDTSGAAPSKSKTDREQNDEDDDDDDKDEDEDRDKSKSQDQYKDKDGNEADKNKKPIDKERNNPMRDKDDENDNKGRSREDENRKDGR